MRLKTLRLHGFKSFADRTTLDFRDGVTAIVGSNGCGKSNIADSIRWVLGEQRASAMRGAKMEEVIFQGTARRRPLHFAEVSLLFDNESGRIPVPQTELEIARKVFREGGSDYSLNRSACRLRDVQGLLRDTGLGSNAYAIIESTMIETLLSDRAEERRALFEEAAGIGKYKDSRKSAIRRLEAAEADLTRLADLITEVESKVRLLSRQKRKAERYRELQAGKLDYEVALARHEAAHLDAGLSAALRERSRLEEEERSGAAERSIAEAMVETGRIEASELGRERTAESSSLDAIRVRLNEREREILLSQERRNHAELRLRQLIDDRGVLEMRGRQLEKEIEALQAEHLQVSQTVEEVRGRAAAKEEENSKVRQELSTIRREAEIAAEHSRKLAREIASSQGERTSEERRGREARDRQGQLLHELEAVEHELAQMTGQTELWETEAEEVRHRLDAATESLDVAVEAVTIARGREARARDELRIAEDRLSTLTGQIDAREALARSYEGFAPAVAAIMAAREAFPGVHGPLADYIDDVKHGARAGSVEKYLGPLLQALVVDDMATVRAIRQWFREEWRGGGSLVLLPLEAAREQGRRKDPPAGGGTWVDLLLTDFLVVDGDPLGQLVPGVNRLGAGGDIVDARGVVRLLELGEGQGILARREALERLRAEAAEAVRERDARLRERDEVRDVLHDAEEALVTAGEHRRVSEAQLAHLQMDAAAHHGRHERLQQERETVQTNLVAAESMAVEAAGRLIELDRRLEELSRDVEVVSENESAARSRLNELEIRWEIARDEEAEIRVLLANGEADFRDGGRRLRAGHEDRDGIRRRLAAVDAEAAQIRAVLEELSGVSDHAAEEIAELFRQRDEKIGALALLDARLAEVDSELSGLAERVRAARRRESEAAEGRHKIDLEVAESRSRLERVRERLEAEWSKPWAALIAEAAPVDGDVAAWRSELRRITEQLDSVGPVNMLAVEEHAEEDRRLAFLLKQQTDLLGARDNLVTAIRQINRTAREIFESTFEAVRENFRRTFQSLFHGGDCDLWLADPDDPLESVVEIQASPHGKKTQRIHLLSGGERTLTALALLFALYLVKPSPFCVLDEVDAPLDESNVGRFIQLLNDFKHETQFIVITHNPRTMEAADWVYGVTMEDPGVSTIVGVELVGTWAGTSGAGRQNV
jgi:chromosome segregation protein